MAQWINLNQNNRSVIAHQYSALSEKVGLVLLPLVGLTAGLLAGRQNAGGFKILYRPNYLYFYFFNLLKYYLCISTGFSQLKLILRYVLRHKIIRLPFFPYQSLLLSTVILNDNDYSSLRIT